MALAHQQEIGVEIDAHHFLPFFSLEGIDAAACGEDPCIQNQHIQPAEFFNGLFQRLHELRFRSQIALQTQKIRVVLHRRNLGLQIQRHNCRTSSQQRFDAGLADARSSTGNQRHFALKLQRFSTLAQLRLFQVPILHIKNISGRQCPIAPQSRSTQNDVLGVIV